MQLVSWSTWIMTDWVEDASISKSASNVYRPNLSHNEKKKVQNEIYDDIEILSSGLEENKYATDKELKSYYSKYSTNDHT